RRAADGGTYRHRCRAAFGVARAAGRHGGRGNHRRPRRAAMSEGLVLGIDGGGSKTLIALADRTGRIVRVARGKGVNPMDNRNWRGELDAQLQPFVGVADLVALAAALPAFGEVDHIS